ncbi:MAG TPA: sulfate ABC transporter permease subunit CysW [Candidatus Polarisedimenticolaceae bacterium]|nr:sulfate ABC transporter permease subunit CysW [Candidatus Polarisedimenticolaceae bacterium]
MERHRTEPAPVRIVLILVSLVFLLLILFVPLLAVFVQAFGKGIAAYRAALAEPDTLSALKVTLIAAAVVVPLNAAFGIAAAWLLTRFRLPGKAWLITLLDVPFSVSPVITGMAFVLLFGASGLFGTWLQAHDVKIIFALPGIVLATLFVTSPLVARELIPLLSAQGTTEEESALTLGASGWRTFWHVSLPKMRWGLLYGIVLCNARAMGEFGAVSVVSGHIRGVTNTLPLHIEVLYNDYQFSSAFAVSSLLTLLALATLVVKSWVEWRGRPGRAAA